MVGQLIYSGGMVLMALTKSTWGVLVFSWSAGVMYSTLFTMPYIIVANYHEKVWADGGPMDLRRLYSNWTKCLRLFNLIKHPEYVGDSTSTAAGKNSREQLEQARHFPV